MNTNPSSGIVVIGRNEGGKLKACFSSLAQKKSIAVYVDSGSTDQSLEIAQSFGIYTISLDPSRPFNAARGRNEGFAYLVNQYPAMKFTHFIDGDCVLDSGWLQKGTACLEENPEVAVVCGYRRESCPEDSVYNLLCDLEWQGPSGVIDYCGGDFLVRAQLFKETGGFDEKLDAGEEPELCLRIRRLGRRILRLNEPMTQHSAEMKSFGQWWHRNKRCGYAYMSGFKKHGLAKEKFRLREVLSILFWAVGIPLLIFTAAVKSPGWIAWFLLAYTLLFVNIVRSEYQKRGNIRNVLLYAFFCILGKFPQALGLGAISYRYRPQALRIARSNSS